MSEKESGIKEYQDLLGISKSLLWVGRLLDVLIRGFFCNIPLAVAMSLAIQIRWDVLWFCLLLYNLKAACYLSFWSCFFRSKLTALITLLSLWITTSQIAAALLLYPNVFSKTTRYTFAFFFPNIGLAVSLMHIVNLERSYKLKYDEERCGYEFALGVVSTISSIIFYFILILLIDPMWHPRKGMYWPTWLYFPKKIGQSRVTLRWDEETAYSRIVTESTKTRENFEMFEKPPYFSPEVRIINVVKDIYTDRGKFPIIDNVSVDIFANEVTFILGETGSGKSTLIHLLLGSSLPDSGELYFGHLNVNDNNDLYIIRAQIGWCPQNNIFPGCMTIKQLLIFAGKLRGLSSARITSELEYLLDALELEDVSNKIASTVPSPTARLVCFAFAVMGKPPVIILDEPTDGVDLPARRRLWKIVKMLRKDHTIIVASNHMEEVEEMADRIFILKDGKMVCWGTPQYLKNHFGTCMKVRVECSEKHDSETIENRCMKYIKDVHFKSLGPGDIVCYMSRKYASKIPKLVRKLRKRGVEQVVVSVCGMQDLFLEATESGFKLQTRVSKIMEERLGPTSVTTDVDEEFHTASCLAKFTALFVKEQIVFTRSWPIHIIRGIITSLILTFIITTCEYTYLPEAEPAKLLSVDIRSGVVMYEDHGSKGLERSYKELVREHGAQSKLVADAREELKKICNVDRPKCGTMLVGARLKWSDGEILEPGTPLYTHSSIDAGPISVNLLSNAVLRTLQGKNISISTYTHPLPNTQPYVFADLLGSSMWQDLMPMMLGLWMVSYIRSAYEENTSGCYRAQIRAGASPLLLWTARFFSHIIWHCVHAFVLTFVVFCVSTKTYSCPSAIGAILFLWLMYGFGEIPFIYFLSKLFSTVDKAVLCVTAIMVASTAFFYVEIIFRKDIYVFSKYVYYFAKIFPSFVASSAFRQLQEQIIQNSPCRLKRPLTCPISYHNGDISERECTTERHYVQSLSQYLWQELVLGVVYLSIVILMDTHVARHAWMWLKRWLKYLTARIKLAMRRRRPVASYRSSMDSSLWDERSASEARWPDAFEDPQVAEERDEAYQAYEEMPFASPAPPPGHPLQPSGSHALVATGLVLPSADPHNPFPAHVVHARRLGFRVRAGESLALLGLDRSGCHALLRVLAGHSLPSAGDVAGVVCRLRENQMRYRSHVGFAGWHTGLMANLTVLEHLDLFCRLHGVKTSEFCTTWVEVFGLGPRLHQKTGSMTTGQRRALAVALAFVAEPSAVMLDQPALGMDPRARSRLAAAFADLTALRRAIVLTTTTMEDVEVLCHRGIVLEGGQITVLGTPLRMRDVLRMGYVVAFLLQNISQDVGVLKRTMKNNFGSSCFFYEVDKQVRVRFQIQNPDLRCEDLLEILERVCKEVPNVILYSIHDISPLRLLS